MAEAGARAMRPAVKGAGSPDSGQAGRVSSCGSCSCHLPGPSSKFRHAQGTVLHRDSHITNLKGLNLTTPGESDGFCANRLRVAVPLLSSGGQVAVLEVRNPTHTVPPRALQEAKGIGYPHQLTLSEHRPCARHVPGIPFNPFRCPAGPPLLSPFYRWKRAVRHREV